ncbi:hypothetical protein PTSG_05173 [Salpingoeca rosetta]|uniref:DUF389 domain-containing protein n=1 Tax=Salpingoeca rosetta (strain ATCC 50818 / BSB-021) TaxID=946362 RepID=F2UAQ2_SALR5|nr:uncharacterized protein PTSG_05173 [Salpingoeca rosetta]EGD73468.1 hypothetical protein PTSG_05173 [Salpingoeca rosetta]|eukprot:XP_004993750.1 hypothetical protein PTSG_05173 [Salpingoeca rosetta]
MARHISVTIAREMEEQLTAVENHLRNNVHVHNLVVIHTSDNSLFRFQATNRRARECIEALQRLGVGHAFGSMEIMDVKSVIPRISNHPTMVRGQKKQREYNPTNSLTLEEIYETVEKGYHLTFEYLGMCSAASIVCAVGLVTNSDPSVVASMLLSPLMGPILGITLGTACMDWGVTLKALRNELIGVLLTLAFGIITGFIVSFYGEEEWETDQMQSRGTVGGLAPGVLIALPCGVALAISVTSADSTILVGVAIAAALLPPIVNAGLEFAFGLVKELPLTPEQEPRHLKHAANSFLLFLLNWIAIYFGCLLVFAVKRVQPRIYHAKPRAETIRALADAPLPPPSSSLATNTADGDTRAAAVAGGGAATVTLLYSDDDDDDDDDGDGDGDGHNDGVNDGVNGHSTAHGGAIRQHRHRGDGRTRGSALRVTTVTTEHTPLLRDADTSRDVVL